MTKSRLVLVISVALTFALASDAVSAQTTRASGWGWPVIPGCLADPEIKTNGATDYNAPICSVYERLLRSGVMDVELISARRLNADMDGVLYPAFLPGTEVVRFIVTGKFNHSFRGADRLVRVSTKAASARSGSWWTTLATVSEDGHVFNAERIRAKLALTDTPLCIAYAEKVRTGVRAYLGVVAPAFDEPGGGVEFWFPPNAVATASVGDVPGTSGCDNEPKH